jgi:putative membrane protein insertion efficiency factor
MTKEFPMTNAESSVRTAVSGLSFGFRHSLVISASSLVIRLLSLAIRAYQLTISPAQTFLFGPTGGCRFTPTCSQYALDAIHTHGAFAGGALAARRICRCHPWGGCGHDPVPEADGGWPMAHGEIAAAKKGFRI